MHGAQLETLMTRWPITLTLLYLCCTAAAAEPQVTLQLAPTDANPRNSEGDFVQLRDGRILFVYTRFSSGGSDHDRGVF